MQVLEATPNKTDAARLPAIHHRKNPSWTNDSAGHSWRSKDELKSDVLLRTPSHGRAKVRQPAKTYIQQLCADTGCNLEDLLGAMDDGWWEWETWKYVLAVQHDADADDDYNYYFRYFETVIYLRWAQTAGGTEYTDCISAER